MPRKAQRERGRRRIDTVLAERGERMFTTIATAIRRRVQATLRAAHRPLLAWIRPATGPFVGGAVGELARTKAALVAENAFLRHHLVVLARQVQRPVPTPAVRLRLVWRARSRGASKRPVGCHNSRRAGISYAGID